jgi:hypothetical protein
MDASERAGFKEQLRAMAAGRGDGIDLDSEERWVIQGLEDAPAFFRHLDLLIPGGGILYFEGTEIAPEVAQFYERNRAPDAVCVARDTIFPIPETFHVSMKPEVVAGLLDLLRQHPTETCFHHMKAYREAVLLFTFHDAFDGSDLLVSDRVSEENVCAFASRLGAASRRETNINRRDPEQLRLFLKALENPRAVRVAWPWWKKALLFWK